MPSLRSLRVYLASVLAILAGLLLWRLAGEGEAQQVEAERTPLALFSSLPLYWGEAADVSELLGGEGEPHWARGVIGRHHELTPLDILGEASLAPFENLLLAQPRALSPQENVALDAWVRAGGRLLLFADPLLTAESRFAPGDPRRPVDGVLLSPILAHWGLELTFDAAQPEGERELAIGDIALPVEMAGGLRRIGPTSDAACEVSGNGIAATCTIGEGRALILGDAALFDTASASRAAALSQLIERAFAE